MTYFNVIVDSVTINIIKYIKRGCTSNIIIIKIVEVDPVKELHRQLGKPRFLRILHRKCAKYWKCVSAHVPHSKRIMHRLSSDSIAILQLFFLTLTFNSIQTRAPIQEYKYLTKSIFSLDSEFLIRFLLALPYRAIKPVL